MGFEQRRGNKECCGQEHQVLDENKPWLLGCSVLKVRVLETLER